MEASQRPSINADNRKASVQPQRYAPNQNKLILEVTETPLEHSSLTDDASLKSMDISTPRKKKKEPTEQSRNLILPYLENYSRLKLMTQQLKEGSLKTKEERQVYVRLNKKMN